MTTLPLAGPPASAPVACPLCGFEYVPGGDSCREHGCPIAFGGCATRHCPRCGYTMPDEEKSLAARLVRRLFRRRVAHAAGTLAELPAGSFGVVETIEGDPALQARLTSQGLAPGVVLHVLQRVPTYVIEVGETTIALETRVAEAVRLRVGEPVRESPLASPSPFPYSDAPASPTTSSTASGSRVTKPSP